MSNDDSAQAHTRGRPAHRSMSGQGPVTPTAGPATRDLDVGFYQAVYADLASFRPWRAKLHWRRVGHRENRFPNMQAALAAAYEVGGVDFDPAAYLFLNEDLAPAGVDSEERAVVHYASVGHLEERAYRPTLGGGGLLAKPVTGAAKPATELPRTWPVARPFHERSTDWRDPVDLASQILGRPLDADRAGITDWLGPMEPFERAVSALTCNERMLPERALNEIPPEDFVIFAFMGMYDRAPWPSEFDGAVTALDRGDVRRDQLLLQWAANAVHDWRNDWNPSRVPPSATKLREAEADSAPSLERGPDTVMSSDLSFLLLGTGRMFSRADWDARVRDAKSSMSSPVRARTLSTDPADIPAENAPLVTVLSSIFRPGEFLRPFFEQIVQQTIFDRVELICVLVQPTDGELAVAREYEEAFPNIVLRVESERIGIYTAWNQAVNASSGRFVTNANVDDLRRPDSLEVQARTLLQHEWVDVVYQDVLYTLDSTLTWQEIEEIGFRTNLPPVTRWTLPGLNSPHNAPMWRRALHDDVGLFDDTFHSAGDYEFWLRCVSADKMFFKVRDAHVAYYVNPNGLSTRPGSAGRMEGLEIGRRYLHLLDYPEPPANLAAPDLHGPSHPRAERMTLSVCDQLVLVRSLLGDLA